MAIEFNQIADVVTLPDALLDGETGAGSVWAMVYVDNSNGNNTILCGASTSQSASFGRVYLLDGGATMHPAIQMTTGFAVRTTASISQNAWHSILFTTDGSTWKIYIDGGAAEALTIVTGSNNGSWFGDAVAGTQKYDLGVLRRSTGTVNWFGGKLANIFVWDSELSEANGATLNASPYIETALAISPGNNVVGWEMNDGADGTSANGDTVADAVSSNDGTGVGGIWRAEPIFSSSSSLSSSSSSLSSSSSSLSSSSSSLSSSSSSISSSSSSSLSSSSTSSSSSSLAYDFMGIGGSIAEGHPAYHGPEHGGPSGDPDSQIWPWLVLERGLDEEFYNAGIGGTTTSDTNTRIQALLDSKQPNVVYLHIGINDLFSGVPLATVLANLDAIKTKVEDSGAALIVLEVSPANRSEADQSAMKISNAAYEKWCLDNSIKYCPVYQEMADTNVSNEDNLLPGYSADGTHPNVAGYTRMGELCAYPTIPDRTRDWGNAGFVTWPHESWRWWILSGTASVSGDADTGTLLLPQNDTADGPVKCIEQYNKTVTITPAVGVGSVTTKYRTSSTNFDRDDAAAWLTYSAPFVTNDQFIQIRLIGASVADANITEAQMTWTAGSSSSSSLSSSSSSSSSLSSSSESSSSSSLSSSLSSSSSSLSSSSSSLSPEGLDIKNPQIEVNNYGYQIKWAG